MEDELNGYAATLVDETQMVMDEFQTPVMAFTSTILDKIEDLLDCKDITVEHCKIMDKAGKISTCTVEHPLSACHPIAYFPLSNPSFHFSVDYCCSNNSKCSASLS